MLTLDVLACIAFPFQASGVESMTSVSLASHRGDFSTLDELRTCMRASMLVPGMAGPPMTVYRNSSAGFDRRNSSATGSVGDDEASHPSLLTSDAGIGAGETSLESCDDGQEQRESAPRKRKAVNTDAGVAVGSEPFVDAMVFQALPYRCVRRFLGGHIFPQL